MEKEQGQVVQPNWNMALLMLLFSYSTPVIGNVQVSLSLLCIPLAALLAQRYRWQGVLMVAIGGLLLPIGLRTEIGFFRNDMHVYVIALTVASLIASGMKPLSTSVLCRVSLPFVLMFLLLPIKANLYMLDLGGGTRIMFSLLMMPVLFFVLFLQGWSNARASTVLAALTLATILGISLKYSGLYEYIRSLTGTYSEPGILPRYFGLRSSLNAPVYWLTGIAFFLVGRYMLMMESNPEKPVKGKWLVWGMILLLLLWAGNMLYAFLPRKTELTSTLMQWKLLGTTYVIPLTAFFAGLAFRFKGVAWIAAFSVATELGEYILKYSYSMYVSGGRVELHEPLYCLAFGALGLRVGDIKRGIETKWEPFAWITYGALLAVMVPIATGLTNATSVVSVVLLYALMIGLGILGKRLYRRLRVYLLARSLAALTSIIGLVMSMVAIAYSLTELGIDVVDSMRSFQALVRINMFDNISSRDIQQIMLLTSFLSVLVVVFTLLKKIFISMPELVTDTRRLAKYFKGAHGDALYVVSEARASDVSETEPLSPAMLTIRRIGKVTGWIRGIFLVILAYCIWLMYWNIRF